MGTEGIMGIMGLFPEIPIIPAFPEIPIIPAFPEIPENSPKKAQPFNDTHLPQARDPNFLSEGVRFGSDTKTGGWDILSVFPIRQFD